MKESKTLRYSSLNLLRVIGCMGIVVMHIGAFGNYDINGHFFNTVIPTFKDFVFMFMIMIISAFSMCCGYYSKLKDRNISLDDFYKRRITRIWPFFALFCTMEMIWTHSMAGFFEWIADISLIFSLLPNPKISIVGIGWFVGIIFAFYMMFPFFVYVIWEKKRAWFCFIISIIINIICNLYFFDRNHVIAGYSGRENIVYCSMFFLSGGLMYLYRNSFRNNLINKRILLAVPTVLSFLFYYMVEHSVYALLIFFSCIVLFALLSGGYF